MTKTAAPTCQGLVIPPEVMPEYMNYQYLPIKMADSPSIRVEPRLAPVVAVLRPWLESIDTEGLYVYLTAKHLWATPANPLNRPGWHIDAYGHPVDRNFVWSDVYETRYVQEGVEIPTTESDAQALALFEDIGDLATLNDMVKLAECGRLWEFGQQCIHATPIVPAPGGFRRFIKVSLSPDKYNLAGNSINHLFDYNWTMYDREAIRNDPQCGESDSVK